MHPRKITAGTSEVYDTFNIALDTLEPLQITYYEDTPEELKLVFRFNLIEASEMETAGVTMDSIGDTANFNISVVRGSRGSMSERLPIAESQNSTLYIYTYQDASKRGKVNFGYTLFNHKKPVLEVGKSRNTKALNKKKKKHGK